MYQEAGGWEERWVMSCNHLVNWLKGYEVEKEVATGPHTMLVDKEKANEQSLVIWMGVINA